MRVHVVLLLLGAFLTVLPVWFYSHCARPCLAMEGGRERAFSLTIVATILASLAGIAAMVEAFVPLPTAIRTLGLVGHLTFAIPAIGFLRPRWIVRLTGGPDPTAAIRFVVWWHRRRWEVAEPTVASMRGFAENLRASLAHLPAEVDPELRERWTRHALDLRHAADNGVTSLGHERSRFADALATIRPVDPLAAWLP